MDKATLRREIKIKRQKLSSAEIDKLSRHIINHAWQVIDWRLISSMHIYLPLKNLGEIDTIPLIKAARQEKPDLKIASTDPSNLTTNWLDENLMPIKQVPLNFQYGLIIVPMLGFDARGHRLGHGGGFYDRFLSDQAQALTIGLCLENGRVIELPNEPHDMALNFIVTEKTIYKF